MFEKLLARFQEINKGPSKSRERNIFEICGFPHYENVISNILAFFFDANGEHNLKDLLIKSLIDSGISQKINDVQFNVEREVRTEKGGFIDILLYNESDCLVIENKIYASLNNDLDDYIEYARRRTKLEPIGILLTLYKTQSIHPAFVNITYQTFIHKIKHNLGNYLNANYNKFLFLLLEFINNLEYLSAPGVNMDTKFIDFIRKNEEEVKQFGIALKAFHDDLRRLVKDVNSIVLEQINDSAVKQWPYRELPKLYDTAVSDFRLSNGVDLAIDSVVNASGWEFQIFVRRYNGNQFDLEFYCKNKGLIGTMREERFILSEHYELEVKPEDIAMMIVELIKRLRA